MQRRKVHTGYKTIYADPIVLNIGDEVTLGREEESEKWKGWVWAETPDNKGWVPKQIVSLAAEGKGIITEFYTAKELDVSEGDEVEVIKDLNGWAWVRNLNDDEGWIPLEVIS